MNTHKCSDIRRAASRARTVCQLEAPNRAEAILAALEVCRREGFEQGAASGRGTLVEYVETADAIGADIAIADRGELTAAELMYTDTSLIAEQVDLLQAWERLTAHMRAAIFAHGDEQKTAGAIWATFGDLEERIAAFEQPGRTIDPLASLFGAVAGFGIHEGDLVNPSADPGEREAGDARPNADLAGWVDDPETAQP